MFKELFALAERAPVLLLVSREGDAKLRVNLTRKKDEDEKEVPLSISIVATPDELDAELPLALAEGLALSGAPEKSPSVTDQVKGQIEAGQSSDEKPKKKTPVVRPKVKKMKGEPRAKKSPPAPAPKKPAAAKPAKRSATPRAAKAKGITEPNATLAAIIGPEAATHNEAMVRAWGYIKEHGLKGKPAPKGGSWINADEKLKALFGGKDRIASTQLASMVRQNLVAKATTVDPTPQITPLLTPEKLDALAGGGGGGNEPATMPTSTEAVSDVTPSAEPASSGPAIEQAQPETPAIETESKPAAPAPSSDNADDLDLF